MKIPIISIKRIIIKSITVVANGKTQVIMIVSTNN